MDKTKLEQLEAKGWVVTTPEEFLELTPEEVAYIELKLLLSRRLRERREELNLSQQALAEMLESSQSRVSRMEAGDPAVSIDLLVRSLFRIGVTRAELGEMVGAIDDVESCV